jgi:hypothetical protein
MDARYSVVRFHAEQPHASRVLYHNDSIKLARYALRAVMCGAGEGIEIIDNHTGKIVATRGEKRS